MNIQRFRNSFKATSFEHYLVFTNRKKPANNGVEKEKALRDLGLKTAHILGAEQLREWLTQHHESLDKSGVR